MKTLTAAIAALGLSALAIAGPATEAKADGGVVIGVGAYLVVDAIVGKKCHRHDWPFNMVAKIADELHGRPGCHRDRYYDDRYDRRHRKYYK